MKQTQSGFTLIELMIAVAIVGILAAIAFPSYQESVRKSRRADAEGALLGFANAMERHFTEFNSYCDAAAAGGTVVALCGTGTEDTGAPAIYAPPAATAVNYTFTILAVTPTPTTYILQAAPVAGSSQANDKCGTLTVNNTGAKTNSNGLPQPDECW